MGFRAGSSFPWLALALAGSAVSTPASGNWPTAGLPLCSSSYSSNFLRPMAAAVPDSAGGLVVIGDFSYDNPRTCPDVRVDSIGSMSAWPASGAAPPASSVLAVSDGRGGVIAAWPDYFSTAHPRWLAAGWNADGIPSWNAPVVLATLYAGSSFACLTPDGTGGAFFAWTDGATPAALFAQHVNSDGTRVSPSGLFICGTSSSELPSGAMTADGSGGAILVWSDGRNRYTSLSDIYAQRVSAALEPMWGEGGAPVCVAASVQQQAVVAPDGSGGAFVAWEDWRNNPPNPDDPITNLDIFVQHVTSIGAIATGWDPAGSSGLAAPGVQRDPALLPDGEGGAFLAWSDAASAGSPARALRIDADGAPRPGWPAGGMEAGSVPGSGGLDGILPDHTGGIYLVWNAAEPAESVRAQHLGGGGGRANRWPPEGAVVVTASAPSGSPRVEAITDDHFGDLNVVWSTSSIASGNVLYERRARKLESDGVVAVQLVFTSFEAEPGVVRLRWFSAGDAPASATLERRRGSGEWTSRAELVPDGAGYLAFEDREVAPGAAYGYRLAYSEDGALARTPEVIVNVPRAFELALDSASPNPGHGSIAIAFTLPADAGGAKLELFDVSGRRVWSRSLAGLAAGRHSEHLPASIPAGVYRVRLDDARGSVSRAVVVLD